MAAPDGAPAAGTLPTSPISHPGGGKPLLLWDGDCGFCARSVEWVESQDTAGKIVTLPYQRCPSPPMTPELRKKSSRAVQLLLPDGRHLEAGRAALWVLGELGWTPAARLLSLPPLVQLVELGYRWVANNRGVLSRWLFRAGKGPASCALPPASEEAPDGSQDPP